MVMKWSLLLAVPWAVVVSTQAKWDFQCSAGVTGTLCETKTIYNIYYGTNPWLLGCKENGPCQDFVEAMNEAHGRRTRKSPYDSKGCYSPDGCNSCCPVGNGLYDCTAMFCAPKMRDDMP